MLQHIGLKQSNVVRNQQIIKTIFHSQRRCLLLFVIYPWKNDTDQQMNHREKHEWNRQASSKLCTSAVLSILAKTPFWNILKAREIFCFAVFLLCLNEIYFTFNDCSIQMWGQGRIHFTLPRTFNFSGKNLDNFTWWEGQ